MNIESRLLADIVPYAKNAKKHDNRQINNVAESIKQYGFVQPIVIDRDGVIVIGHCRALAAKKLGMKEVPCVCVDDLTPEQVNALRIVDNKSNESDWDYDLLADELAELDLSDFDFDFGIGADEEEESAEVVEVDVPDFDEDEEPTAKFGQIYQLGNHRLMCGDSTRSDMFKQLVGGAEIDCVCTDPPYNMAYEGAGRTPKERRKKNKIANDNLPKEEFDKFLLSVYKCLQERMKDGASFYVFYKELGEGVFIRLLEEAGLTFKQELIWVKNQLVLGGAKYQNMYEPCLFGCKGKSVKSWYGGRKNRSVIEHIDLMNEEELRNALRDLLDSLDPDIVREKKVLVNDLHPTMKPIKLLAKLLRNSTKQGDCVLDAFGGSGSTLMACEQIGRSCYMMEFEPKYVDVIIKRWEDFTGEKAVLLNDDR